MNNGLWEPDFERMLTVLRLEGEPDRVPFIDLFFDYQVAEPVVGRAAPQDPDEERKYRVEFMAKAGYDYVMGRHSFGFPGRERLIADDTAIRGSGQRGWRDEAHGPLESWEMLEQYQWPKVEDASFEDIEKLGPLLPDGMKVIPVLPNGPLENLVGLMGYEPLCYALRDEPELVRAVADHIGQASLELYEVLCDFDHVGAVSLNDDLGFKTQTMIGPEDLRKYVFPWHRRLTECAHEHGKPVILHACGNCGEVMEDLIEDVGVDGKHSFEDVIQPVAEFKRQYGPRIAALGGIDVDVLSRRGEEEVRQYTRKVIEECAPGGGWALGSGNSITNYMPVENYLAMLDEGRKVGVYRR
jgi:uroporphyrinogen decarboxylase